MKSHSTVRRLGVIAFVSLAFGQVRAAERIELAGPGIAPESLTSTSNRAFIIGSATRWIYRAQPGKQTATPWIAAPGDGPRSIFGVFADEREQVLWACAGSVPASTSELYAFDLRTGALRARYPLPTAGGICNDIAVAKDGTVFATDSTNMQIVRLRAGEQRLTVWVGVARDTFGDPKGIIDGIAVLGGRVLVNTLITRKLFAVDVRADGAAGAVTEVVLNRALAGPDGMRSFGDDVLFVAETGGEGALARVVVNGDKGDVSTVEKGFAHGAVAVTVSGGVAYVLGNRALAVAKEGEAVRFEAVAVVLPR